MANEITVDASLTYVNAGVNITQVQLAIKNPGQFTISGSAFSQGTILIPTTAGGTAIPVGSLSALGWALLKNNDPTNYLEILTATSGTKIAKIPPLGVQLVYFPSTITAPAAIANTASCNLQYLILAP